MKKLTLIFVLAGTMLCGNVFAQLDRGDQTKTTTSTDQASKDKTNKDKDPSTRDKEDVAQKAQEMAKEWTAKMDEVLKLTPDQKKKAMAVNEKYAKQILEMKMKGRDSGMTEDQAKAQRDKLTEARLKEYQSFLSKDQLATFKEHRDGLKKDKMSKEEKEKKIEDMTPEQREKMKEEKADKKDKN